MTRYRTFTGPEAALACLGVIVALVVMYTVIGVVIMAAVNVLFHLNWSPVEGTAAAFLLSLITGALRRK